MMTELKKLLAYKIDLLERIGKIKFDDYQIKFICDCFRNKRVIGIFARQSGKTTVIALFSIAKALSQNNFKILVIAPTDRQAGELFDRMRRYATDSELVIPLIESHTLREMRFKNGSWIRAMPTGDFGHNIKGQTADLIILEESSFIKDSIVNAVIMPMIAATNGDVIQIGTPFGKNHFFNASVSDKYAVHKYDYTYCPRISNEFIEEQRDNLDSLEFKTEYMAEFIEDADQYFSTSLISSCIADIEEGDKEGSFYLGVDFARMGEDSSVLVIGKKEGHILKIIAIEELKKLPLTAVVGRIKILHEQYKFRMIYLDETGLGAGPTDFLKEAGLPIEPITFTLQSKMDIFSNLKVQMEKHNILIPDNKKLIYQLLDFRYEMTSSGQLKLHHSDRGHDDYVDGLGLCAMGNRQAMGVILRPRGAK